MISGVVLSISRSRLASLAQLVFLGSSVVGLALGILYTHKTPDLYPNDLHRKIGWVAICVVAAQAIMTLIGSFGSPNMEGHKRAAVHFEAVGEHHQAPSGHLLDQTADPHNIGGDNEPTSPRGNSMSGTTDCGEDFSQRMEDYQDDEFDEDYTEKKSLLRGTGIDRLLSQVPLGIPQRAAQAIDISIALFDRTILLLGFVVITTGIVVYGGVFVSCPNDYHHRALLLTAI